MGAVVATQLSKFSAFRVHLAWAVDLDLGVDTFFPYSVEYDLCLDRPSDDEPVYDFDGNGRRITRQPTAQEKAAREESWRKEREALDRWKALTPEVRTLIGGCFRQLAQLGCITGARNEDLPSIFLIVEGECEFPKALAPWNADGPGDFCLGLRAGSRAHF